MVNLQKNEEELTKSVMEKVNLSKDRVNLEKHVANLSKCVVDISKKNDVDLGATKAKVVVALDYSGSMNNLYENGDIQKAIHKLVPLGLTFDDNASLDVYLFQNTYKKLDDMNIKNYASYVEKVINTSNYSMGGTHYYPVLNAIVNGEGEVDGDKKEKAGFLGKLFGKKKKDITTEEADVDQPTFVLFITDGDNYDKAKTEKLIREISTDNIFIQFIGIGDASFDFLEKLDELPGRKIDNTGFSKVNDLVGVSDAELYTNVLGQFAEWLKNTKG